MLHHHQQTQTLRKSSSPSSFISQSQSPPPPPPPPSLSQVEREKRMESAAAAAAASEFSFSFGSSRGIQAQAGGFHGVGACDDMAWVVEKGNLLSLGDDFLVDELLDFGQLETETEGEEEEEEEEEEEDHHNKNKEHHQIQQQQKQQGKEESLEEHNSAVSFQALPPPPVSELTLPAHDAAELEWVSRIVDDSLSEFPAYPAPKLDTHKSFLPPHSMPMPMPSVTIPVKAKRSKRARTLSWSSSCSSSSSWRSGAPLLFIDSSSAPSSTTTTCSTSSCSSSSSSYSSSSQQHQFISSHQLLDEIPVSVFPRHPPSNTKSKSLFLKKQKQKPKPKPKKRGRKPKSLLLREGAFNSSMSGGSGGGGERRCSHCGVNKTPQWRTGPEGAKTLCNACGVRYKSGRLLPEYRPACSPTFMTHVHSNSHRKVIEMRRKKEEEEIKEKNKLLPLVSYALPVPSF